MVFVGVIQFGISWFNAYKQYCCYTHDTIWPITIAKWPIAIVCNFINCTSREPTKHLEDFTFFLFPNSLLTEVNGVEHLNPLILYQEFHF